MSIRDLARHLNVSIGTVSRALNGKADVSDETRQRVLAAAHELGYSPNQSGRSLRQGVTGMIALVVTPITLLSLIVGGIVVMNIMLVSVTERTFEIGLRKAVGAKKRQILLQFMIESSLMSSVGGVLGLGLASGLSWIVRQTTPIPMTITLGYVLLSLTVSGGIGLIAGIYPAFKASRLDPIVALTKS